MFKTIPCEALAEGLAEGNIMLVDVREAHEYAAGHIPGAISLPLSVFDIRVLPAAAGRQVVFSCAAGVRSRQALLLAKTQGASFDTHFAGGFNEWARAGLPVER